MAVNWIRKRVLITVRTYPTPAIKGVEVSCTAGITDDGQWIRLYPIPYRSLEEDQRFTKYQWIEVDVMKAKNDTRPESYTPNLDTIQVGNVLATERQWRPRWEVVRPLLKPSLCEIERERKQNGFPTLGVFKPAKIDQLVIEEEEEIDWNPQQRAKLNQTLSLFHSAPIGQLEKIPFKFKYKFRCADERCRGHIMSCTDWEAGQSYRKWRKEYGAQWEAAFRQKYETEMIERFDAHFFVGNLHQYPSTWIVVGLFYPPRSSMGDLFDAE